MLRARPPDRKVFQIRYEDGEFVCDDACPNGTFKAHCDIPIAVFDPNSWQQRITVKFNDGVYHLFSPLREQAPNRVVLVVHFVKTRKD